MSRRYEDAIAALLRRYGGTRSAGSGEWEGALGARAPAHAGSALGRAEAASAAQTRDFLAPFFRLCQGRAVPSDLLPLCLEAVGHLLAREYMAAGDTFFEKIERQSL